MKPFTIDAYWVRKDKPGALLEISYELKEGEPIVEVGPLSSEAAAELHLATKKKSWLLDVFAAWLNHKRHIIDANNDATRKDVFAKVWAGYEQMACMTLDKICGRIVKGEAHLRAILPATANTSHQSSLAKLEMLLQFCRNELMNLK